MERPASLTLPGSEASGYAGKVFKQTQKIMSDTRGQAGALVRVLEETQGILGYLPVPILKTISRDLRVPLSEVYGVATFYNFFTLAPRGQHIIQVCMGTACYVRGGERILATLQKELGIEPGGTTSDNKFTLEVVRCLGCCGLSPVVAIGEKVYRRMTPTSVMEVLKSYA